MFNEQTIVAMEAYAIICVIIISAWCLYSFIMYMHDLPEKRKTLHQIYKIRRKKEMKRDEKET
jgi:hypothetical protein